jgi:hypothetical protein
VGRDQVVDRPDAPIVVPPDADARRRLSARIGTSTDAARALIESFA